MNKTKSSRLQLQLHASEIFCRRKEHVYWALAIFLGISIGYLYNIYTRPTLEMTTVMKPTTTINYPKIEPFLINTPGCYIPNYANDFMYEYNSPESPSPVTCGHRAVFIDTLDNNMIRFRIDEKLNNLSAEIFTCRYKFVVKYNNPEQESDYLKYTDWEVFRNNSKVELKHEVILVKCFTHQYNAKIRTRILYEDAYIKIKKCYKPYSQLKTNDTNTQWNILMIGIHDMSRKRVFDTMPLTTKYLKKYRWLDYKGFQKVGQNFSNLLSILTGMKMSNIDSKCKSGLINCTNFLIWKKYKDAGYHTAYGEDYLQLPDAYSKYKGFKGRPTDHYMRSFYLTGENRFGNIVCTKQKPSATHLLEYAHNFIDSYKNNNSFGLFWIKSYTNHISNDPSLLDREMVRFFQTLNNTGVFNKTFIIFFSDQGPSYGERTGLESYYEERLPMLFVWTPFDFRRQYTNEYYNLKFNEGSLITPYDLYITLTDILRKSTNISNVTQSDACPQCTSLFDKRSPNRTCTDLGVSEIWCSCHNMTDVTNITAVHKVLVSVMEHVKNRSNAVETAPCTRCGVLKLFSILRLHKYHDGNKTYYVIDFIISPGSLTFEAIVSNFDVLYIASTSGYNTKGNCALDPDDRPYCVCTVNANCTMHNEYRDEIPKSQIRRQK